MALSLVVDDDDDDDDNDEKKSNSKRQKRKGISPLKPVKIEDEGMGISI